MLSKTIILRSIIAMLAISTLWSCSDDDDIDLPDLTASFSTKETSIGADETSATVTVTLSRKADIAGTLNVTLASEKLAYTTQYTTEPSANGSTVALPVSVGATQVTFLVKKTDGALFDGDEVLNMTLASETQGLLLGANTELKLSFGEVLSTGDVTSADMGGKDEGKQAYFDLSANRQWSKEANSWDLMFTNGSDFVVKLNYSNSVRAVSVGKSDFSAITEQDITDAKAKIPGGFSDPITSIDSETGSLDETAVAPISVTATENMVHLLRFPGQEANTFTWKLAKFYRKNGGYVITHKMPEESTTKTLDVPKNADKGDFTHVSIKSNEIVDLVPANWDIAFTRMSVRLNMGGTSIAYEYKDYVIHGSGCSSAIVTLGEGQELDSEFKAFDKTKAEALELSSVQNTIGSQWRSLGMNGASIKTDRFFVLKDASGNYYKLRFISLTNDGGERGYPKFEYRLLQ
ncbi:hypothetical protein FUAX_08680 [Fulvitalea axinellae]|uniref:HmuY protein n=1 Tax=Fulvitalea axinellae TaxID=1182444 RepID=A0AAU9C8J4_9BACT|nr:hypothetical protein FUAX_08680 [Fulvitalea axinellae]